MGVGNVCELRGGGGEGKDGRGERGEGAGGIYYGGIGDGVCGFEVWERREGLRGMGGTGF